MKDYKKILEGVVDIINATEKSDIGFANICTYIGDNCPELAESEDERIRKILIEVVKRDMVVGGTKDKQLAIAWLEKQDEKDKEILILKDQVESLHAAIKALKEAHKIELEKQGEQKLLKKEDWCFEKGEWYVKLCHDYEGDLRHFQEGHVYQAVSETSITDGYHHVSLGSWQIPKHFRPATKEEIPQEQKAAWSEEDETGLTNTIIMLKEGASLHFNKNDIAKGVDWLKSLKERYTWKPSDEQLEALENVIRYGEEDSIGILALLYNDLKKLKE